MEAEFEPFGDSSPWPHKLWQLRIDQNHTIIGDDNPDIAPAAIDYPHAISQLNTGENAVLGVMFLRRFNSSELARLALVGKRPLSREKDRKKKPSPKTSLRF